MDKQLHTPEEEAYLRMLDREVPDLWSRIEAGLDRADKEGPQNREARFLASQAEGQIVSFEQGRAKRKGNRTGLIIGIVAAAVVLIASLAVIGFAGREKKSADKAESDTRIMDIQGAQSGEVAESIQEKDDGFYGADASNDAVASENAPAPGASSISGDKKKMNGDATWNYRGETNLPEVEGEKSAEEAAEETAEPAAKTDEASADNESRSGQTELGISEVKTLGQLTDFESRMTPEVKAKLSDGKFRIIDEKNGVTRTYVIFGKDSDGEILLLEEGIYFAEGTDADKKTQVIVFSPDQKIGLRMVGGKMEFVISR